MLLFHLSDLHLSHKAVNQPLLFERLVATVRREWEESREEAAAIVVTGDLFDSAADEPRALVASFLALHRRLLEALGGVAPTIVIPGNHDRRRDGLFGPHRERLFLELRDASNPRELYVAGCRTPFLAEVVPEAFHRLPCHVVAYDSSYLPGGFIGAGGTLRVEDLLQAHALLPDDDRPLLVLLHHHLVPTPVTDVSRVDVLRQRRLARWLVGTALPALVSHGDREELTMIALGAGTALSTLHSFGRAVLLLHGHKHVPTARLLRGMGGDCGDLLLVSAGSGGRNEALNGASRDAARLWPSFNRIAIEADSVAVEALSFSPRRTRRAPVRRELTRATRLGSRWQQEPVSLSPRDAAARLELDQATYRLRPSAESPERWDFDCRRSLELVPGATLRRYVEFAHGLPHVLPGAHRPRRRRFVLEPDRENQYQIAGALCRTLPEAARRYGPGTAFEWVGLFCRYGAHRARLRLAEDPALPPPFGTVTDLTTGREVPIRVTLRDQHYEITREGCAPRSLLRLYWPLA